MPINTERLVFDLGGVLVENDMFAALQKLTGGMSQIELKAKWLQSESVRKFELGMCSPDDFSNSMVEEFELSISPADFLAAFTHWPKGLYDGAADLLQRLQLSHKVGCLSNSNEIHWTTKVTAHFDFAYSSHLIHNIKPDDSVFEFVTSDLRCARSDVIFFDDSMPNIEAAIQFGWQAHLTDGYDELLRVLQELKLI